MAAARAAMTVALLVLLGCSAPSAGSSALADGSSAPLASPSSRAAPAPSASLGATSPAPTSPMPSLPPASAAATPTPNATLDPAPPDDGGLRTFPALPDGDCEGMTVDDPLTLTLDVSQPEFDGAMLTDRSDWNVHVVWPQGFAVVDRGGERVLLDERGEVVGRQGDDVTIPKTVIFPSGGFEEPIVAEGVLFGRCHRRVVGFEAGSVVRTTDVGLRMRAAPGTGDGSPTVHDGLPAGTSLYVLDGPVSDDGYHWYRVEWLAPAGARSSGWVAAADRDGRPFVERATLACPPSPTVPSEIAALADGYRVGCFSEDPIEIRARLVPCHCNPTAPMEPSWLMPDYGPDGAWLLTDPGATGSPDLEKGLFLTRHPDVPAPDDWSGDIVVLTGMFDHPDAAGCATPVGDGPSDPADCSGMFVVTAIEPA
jgi:hypothetical protein